jgi:hypothetical protein
MICRKGRLQVHIATLQRAVAELGSGVTWATYGSYLAVAVVLVLVPGPAFCCSDQEHSGRWPAARLVECRRPLA